MMFARTMQINVCHVLLAIMLMVEPASNVLKTALNVLTDRHVLLVLRDTFWIRAYAKHVSTPRIAHRVLMQAKLRALNVTLMLDFT